MHGCVGFSFDCLFYYGFCMHVPWRIGCLVVLCNVRLVVYFAVGVGLHEYYVLGTLLRSFLWISFVVLVSWCFACFSFDFVGCVYDMVFDLGFCFAEFLVDADILYIALIWVCNKVTLQGVLLFY